MIRTGYSFGAAVGSIDDVINRLKDIGSEYAPISDRNSTFGFTRWNKAALKNEMKPIFGVELGVVPDLGEKKPNVDFFRFLAKDDLRPLHDLVNLATSNPGKDPSLLYSQAMAFDGVVKIAGERCRLEKMTPDAPGLYIGLSPSTPKGLYRMALDAGFRFMAVSDNYYPAEADKEFYRVALGRKANTQTYPMHILDETEWRKSVERFVSVEAMDAAMLHRQDVFSSCQAVLKKGELLKPKRTATLRELCVRGAARIGTNLDNPVYRDRLDRELNLIAEKNFEDYFFILEEIISWAKQRMVVGPARGSSCGSLVCYLLDITTIDPIPYGLIFERFIDVNRKDLPDIDVDFSDEQRHLVFDHMEEVYGSDRVARLGTVGMFMPKSAMKQGLAVLRVPSWKAERLLDTIDKRDKGDERATKALEDAFNDTTEGIKFISEVPEARIIARMEGHPNNPSQHAAGMLMTEQPIAEYVAINARTKSAMLDKKGAEDLNLLKIDALGLKQLSVFEQTLTLIGEEPKSGWLEKIPLNDPAAYAVLNEGKFSGVFQFMGKALQGIASQVVIDSFEDIVSITSLARPGPLSGGAAGAWVKSKRGGPKAQQAHAILEEITAQTHGVIIYQEQVMNVVRLLGKMSWEDTSIIRKAIAQTMGDEFFRKYWEKFRDGCAENGLDETQARTIWDQINAFGSYAFNRSHAVAYGVVSYWCCWLKAHHPLEFAAATLDGEKDAVKQRDILREMAVEGVDYIAVDKDHSAERWTVAERDGKKILVGPLTSIKGIGTAMMSEVLTARKRGEPLRPGILKRLETGKTDIDDLFPVDAQVKRLHPDLAAINIHTIPTKISKIHPGGTLNAVVIGVFKTIEVVDENSEAAIEKRGYKIRGNETTALKLWMRDDTDEIFCKISRQLYERWGKDIAARGKKNKAIYAVKGSIPKDFRMISIELVKYLGDMGQETTNVELQA